MADSESSKTIANINKASKALSKGDNIREEMELTVGPNTSWEDFLTPAPMCICLLGELMVISTTADFTLEKNPPKDGFKLMQWPNSFRASLTQVVNAGWVAFNEAHKNMDQIRLMSSDIPKHLKDAVKILLQGEHYELEDLLPVPLMAIQNTADRCLLLATSVEEKFEYVMNLTGEILEACVGAKGKYESEMKDVAAALAVAAENKKTAEEQKATAKKAYNDLQKAVSRAESQYDKAMESLPGAWGIIGINVVEGVANSFNTVLSGVSRIATLGLGTTGEQKSLAEKYISSRGKRNVANATTTTIDEETIKAYGNFNLIKSFADTLNAACLEDNQLVPNVRAQLDSVRYCKTQFVNMLIEQGGGSNNIVQKRLIDLCKEGQQMCERIIKEAESMNDDPAVKRQLADNLLNFNQKILVVQVEGKNILGVCPTDAKAPNQSVLPPDQQPAKGAAQQAVQNARFKIEQSQAQLDHTRERYDKSCEKLSESTARLGKIIADIAKLNIDKIDFEKIRETLIKGIKALGELRQQWTKLVMFFQMMSNIIKCSLNSSLKDFGSYAQKSQEHALKNYPITKLKRDMIYQQAFESAKIAHLVNMISVTYVQVSKQYIMERVAGLGKLQGYDPETEMYQIRQERMALNQGCQEAQAGIKALVMERRREFDMRVDTRMKAIKTELEKALPPPTPSEKKRIQEAVEQGMKTVKESEMESTKGLDPDDFC